MKILYNFFVFFLLTFLPLKADNNVVIKYKVENEIITNLDIINEGNYLIALNNNLRKIAKNELHNIAEKSLINEKIKENTINKFFDLSKTNEFTDKLFVRTYSRLGFNTKTEFNTYLLKFDLDADYVRNKVAIESLWNKLIFDKFKKQVKVDEKKINEKISELKKNTGFIEEYLLSEILFKLNSQETLDDKYDEIKKSINEIGFENSANKFSISESGKFGGKIGWIKKTGLAKTVASQIKIMEIGKISKPIKLPNGYLLLKINDKRKLKNEINYTKEFDKLVGVEKDRQLNNFSMIYFNKLKQKLLINEL